MTSGTLIDDFRPAWWLPGGHSQTLYRKFSPATCIEQVRQRIELADGDFIDLDWAREVGYGDNVSETIVFILHGLCGCSGSSYVLSLQRLLADNDISSVAMNFRGCSGEVNRKAQAYHSGISEDVDEVFTSLVEMYPDTRFVFVGYSLGANVLLKWLGEIGSNPNIRKAVAVSTPFSLTYCSRAMLMGVSKMYGKYFVRRLLGDFRDKQQHFEQAGDQQQSSQIADLGELDSITSIWEFDDRVTAPLHGFKDAEDYYNRCSSINFIGAIQTDTLLIQSRNDPLIPPTALPDKAHLPANVDLQLSDKGGHVGFISGRRDNWLERRILRFLQA